MERILGDIFKYLGCLLLIALIIFVIFSGCTGYYLGHAGR